LAALGGLIGVALAAGPATAGPSPDQLQNRLNAAQARERALQSSIQSDTATIRGFQGRVDDLRARLAGVQASLNIEQAELDAIQRQLRDSRARLSALQAQLIRDRQVLASQLVAQYEGDRPDIVTVILDAHGFADLLERVDALKRVNADNVRTMKRVKRERRAVATETARLARAEARQQRITTAVLIQRNEVAQLKYAVVSRELGFVRARARKNQALGAVQARRRELERQLSQYAAPGGTLALDTAGEYGFFPAPGTNYSVGDEPELAYRLNKLGKALGLHLIGISGYRSPQHSVEVGGFANDPHTQGAASDTPGVEGVPEATLERFGLTRPFGGAAEADHIQLL
jgi:peptidoglycan hydrolase CwlO-like protein